VRALFYGVASAAETRCIHITAIEVMAVIGQKIGTYLSMQNRNLLSSAEVYCSIGLGMQEGYVIAAMSMEICISMALLWIKR